MVDCLLCSPEGQKFRSKTELEAYIREYSLNVNVSDFCFTVRGQHLLDIAASHDSNRHLYKRKRSSSQEAAIDGRLENAVSSEVDNSKPKRKRMKLWERPISNSAKTAVLAVNSDSQVVSSSKKESKKRDNRSNLLNSHVQPTKETGVHKDRSLLAKRAVKLPNTKARRASPKLTVRMKFMSTSSKNLQRDSALDQSSSHSRISGGFQSAADSDSTNVLTSNGEASPTQAARKLVSKQNSPNNKKSEHFTLIRRQISPAKSPTSNRKHDLILPQQSVVSGDESSTDIQWIPPQSPFNLVEESLFHSSWKILVASIILESGQGWLVSIVCQV